MQRRDHAKRLSAIENNIALYRAVCAVHGVVTELTDDALWVRGTPPRFFGHAVTRRAGGDPGEFAAVPSFKDSFAEFVELPQKRRLFTAQWIWAEQWDGPAAQAGMVCRTPAELAEWHREWAVDDPEAAQHPVQFPDALLTDPAFAFVRFASGGGGVLNRSGNVAGISNVFAGRSDANPFVDVRRMAATYFPGLPVVGYERGDSLAQACAAGFVPVGPLQVWV